MDSIEIASGGASFEILFYQNPQPMWIFDIETLRFLEVNDAAIAHYGYSINEFLGMTIRDIRPVEDIPIFEAVLSTLPGANTEKRSFRHKIKDGSVIHVSIISYPVKFEGYDARLVIAHDETEPRLHLERFNLITQATHDAIWDWNLETNSVWWSTSFFQMFGYDEASVEKDVNSWTNRIHPDDLARVMEHIYSVINRGEKNWSDNYRFLKADGSYAYILDRGYTIFRNGKAVRMLGSMMDISQQIELQHAREESESMLQTITSAAPAVLWMSDTDGNVTYVNQKWLDWANDDDINQSLGLRWLNIIHPDDQDRVNIIYLQAHKQKSEYQADYRIIYPDGSIRWVIALGTPRYLSDGTFTGMVGSCTDITRQKHLELQKDEFISTVSHELKTPITSIKAYEQLLTRLNVVDDVRAVGFLSRMRTQISRLDMLVKDLLDISKIESGNVSFSKTEFDVNITLAELITDLQLVFPSHRLIITENQPCKVYADRERFIQLISNLVDNAVKYSPKGNKVYIRLNCDEDSLTCSIQDFGRGILKEQQPFIFDRFYQVNDVYKAPGLGIGLYLCKEIVTRLGGKIWFDTVYEQGTTFYFKLPRHKA
ncbi:PAS domain-containing protein [Mucilaginibacter sp. Bleaf8]|uniref:PAS domain-containing sensor histidine kinase n=1 Tax=Mucilaginibacter sp. Bleaf8 TaxID=2834430 RepID=UPI001BCDACB1|nr:PAS domain-containing sensor histidine kinase [Mucilaginibacter sp. Bleaf8]MBS7564367.1 PAS domain-containing protein [Mucilaginibacter sp. Bleaf8]